MGKIVFDVDKGNFFLSISSFLVFKCMLIKCKKRAEFRVKVTFSEVLRKVKKQHFKVKFRNWDPITIWHNLASGQFLSSIITPPYSTDERWNYQIARVLIPTVCLVFFFINPLEPESP